VTHVVLPAASVPRRADAAEVIGSALLAKAAGRGHRTIAAELGVPAGTVRGWLRRATARAGSIRAARPA
jgi:DNA-directed RNA polymerase specialized sigma24 family protein